jgi:pimeloyl-ACP methyl ester carboxylesterase
MFDAVEPLIEHRVELAGYDTRALELEGHGAPLLLLHGWSDSADTWRLVLDHLARLGRRAIALDQPGFGTASPLDRERPVLEQLDEFCNAALERFAPEGGAVIVGNSMGGCVALRAAERSELELAGVVPVAPAGLDMARWIVLIEADPLVRALLASPVPVPGPVVRMAVSQVYRRLAFRNPGKIDPRIIATFASHLGSKGGAARALAVGRRLRSELRDPFRLDRICCPVMLVWGRQDLLVFQTGAQRVLAAVDDARLEVVEDCGHCPQLECPDRLCELILDFPSRLARAVA